MLPLQEPINNDNEEELAGAAASLSLLSPTDNSNSQHLNQSHMKYYSKCLPVDDPGLVIPAGHQQIFYNVK